MKNILSIAMLLTFILIDPGSRVNSHVTDKKPVTCQDVNAGKPALEYYLDGDTPTETAYQDYLADVQWWLDLHERPCKINPVPLGDS